MPASRFLAINSFGMTRLFFLTVPTYVDRWFSSFSTNSKFVKWLSAFMFDHRSRMLPWFPSVTPMRIKRPMAALNSPLSNSFQSHPLLELYSLLCLLLYWKIVVYFFSEKNNSKASNSIQTVTFGPAILLKMLASRVREDGGGTEFHFFIFSIPFQTWQCTHVH